jgi:hypothetical protein
MPVFSTSTDFATILSGLNGAARDKFLTAAAKFAAKAEAGKKASITIAGVKYTAAKGAFSSTNQVTFKIGSANFDPQAATASINTLSAAVTTATSTPSPTPATPSPSTGQTFTLTTSADLSGVITGSAGTTSTAGADTFTATDSTYGAGDVLIGGEGNDILNLALTANNNAATAVIGVETINVTATSFTGLTFNAGGITASGATVNLANAQVGGATDFTVTGLGSGATVAAGTGVTGTLSVTTAAATSQTLTLSANSATTQTVVLTHSGAADVSTISAAGTVGYTATTIETQNFSGNGAAVTYTLASDLGATTNSLTGAQSVTLQGTAARFAGKTLTDSTTAGTTTVKITTTSSTADLSKVGVDLVELAVDTAGHTYTVQAGQAIKESTAHAGVLTLDISDNTSTDVTGSVSLDLAGSAVTAGVTLDTAGDKITSLTITNNTVAQTSFDLIAGSAADVVISGSKAVTLATTSTAKSVNGGGLTAALSVTYDGTSDIATVTGGSAADVFTAGTAAVTATINGGAGNDTLTVAAASTGSAITFNGGEGAADKITLTGTFDAKSLTLSGVEIIDLDGTAVTDFKVSQLSGQSFVIVGDAAADTIEINDTGSIDSTTIDLSKLTIDTANVTSIVIDGSKVAATIALGQALTVTGSSIADTVSLATNSGNNVVSTGAGADIVTGGAGNDSITGGEAADTVTGGAGNDSIVLTESTAASDVVILTATGLDSVTGFTSGSTSADRIDFGITDLEAAYTLNFQLLNADTDITAGTASSVQEVTADAAVAAGATVFALVGATFANTSAVEDALETGAFELSGLNAGVTTGDGFVVVYSDGTDAYVAIAKFAADPVADLVAGDLSITNAVKLVGNPSITAGEFVAGNFDFIA